MHDNLNRIQELLYESPSFEKDGSKSGKKIYYVLVMIWFMLTVQGTTLLSIQKLWGHQKKWQIPELLSFVSNPLAVINFCFSAILCFK